MYKFILAFLAMTVFFAGSTFASDDYKNYQLSIDGQIYDLNLNEEVQILGKTAKLSMKPYTKYSDRFLSFQHKNKMSVTSQDLGSGITQVMTMTATGTFVMIQEYANMEPASLVPMMFKELTKEKIDYGYQMVKEPITRKTKSGDVLKGLKAIMTYKGEKSYLEVLAYEKKDIGILVMTNIDTAFMASDKDVHTRFWDTFKLKF